MENNKETKLIEVLNKIKNSNKLSDKLVSFTLVPKLVDPQDEELVMKVFEHLDWSFINQLFNLINKECSDQDLLLINLSFHIISNFFNYPKLINQPNCFNNLIHLWKIINFLKDDELLETLINITFNCILASHETLLQVADISILSEIELVIKRQCQLKNKDNVLSCFNLIVQTFEQIKTIEFCNNSTIPLNRKVPALTNSISYYHKFFDYLILIELELNWLKAYQSSWETFSIEILNILNISSEFIQIQFNSLIPKFRQNLKSKVPNVRDLTLICSNQLIQTFQLDWLQSDGEFITILIQLSCIEVRIGLEELRSSKLTNHPNPKLVNCLELIKTTIWTISNLLDEDDDDLLNSVQFLKPDHIMKLSKWWFETGMDCLDWLIDMIDTHTNLEELIQNNLIILVLKTLMTYISQDESLIQSTIDSNETFANDEEETNTSEKKGIVDIKYQGGFNCLFPLILGLITLCESELPKMTIPLNDILNGLLNLVSYEELNTNFIYFNGYTIVLNYTYKLYQLIQGDSSQKDLEDEFTSCLTFLEEQLDADDSYELDTNQREQFLEMITYLKLNI